MNDRLVRIGLDDPLVSLRHVLAKIDHLAEGVDPDQLRQSALFLGLELDRRERTYASKAERGGHFGREDRVPLASLDELFEHSMAEQLACEREIGGRSL